jgi:hypothetical protein
VAFGVLGSTVGWLIACGGAFKDAPIAGFEWLEFFPNRPRGRFAGKPVAFLEQLLNRQRFGPLYADIWLIMLGTLILANVRG